MEPLPRASCAAAGRDLPISLDDPRLDTPAVLVDLDIVEANIGRMAGLARREKLSLRPHIKTHKSIAMAQRQLAAGAVGVCCATASEAEVMIAGGVGDVLLAYPLAGRRKFERIAPLLSSTALTLVTDSKAVTASYRQLAQTIGRSIRVMIEIDSGMHRVGVDPRSVVEIAADIASGNDLELRGIMTHAGHSHDATDQLGHRIRRPAGSGHHGRRPGGIGGRRIRPAHRLRRLDDHRALSARDRRHHRDPARHLCLQRPADDEHLCLHARLRSPPSHWPRSSAWRVTG